MYDCLLSWYRSNIVQDPQPVCRTPSPGCMPPPNPSPQPISPTTSKRAWNPGWGGHWSCLARIGRPSPKTGARSLSLEKDIFTNIQNSPSPSNNTDPGWGGGNPSFTPNSVWGLEECCKRVGGLLPTPNHLPHVKWGYAQCCTKVCYNNGMAYESGSM